MIRSRSRSWTKKMAPAPAKKGRLLAAPATLVVTIPCRLRKSPTSHEFSVLTGVVEPSASRNYFVGTEAVISISGSGAEIFFCNYFSPFISNRMVANLNWAESSIKLKFAVLYERDNSVLELEKKQKWIKLYRPHFLMVSVVYLETAISERSCFRFADFHIIVLS